VQVTETAMPRVLAVLVTHDGAAWLPHTLAALAAQTYPELEVVAVDNASTDGSRELVIEHLGVDRVLVADIDLGFGAAVAMALDARPASDAPYVLLVHDDLALAPNAVAELVAAMEQDPRLAIVGSKLRRWGTAGQLQSVGWTIDLTGRADDGVDEGELDQGQRDQERRSLYVSTSGMLVRRQVFDELGRFDRRYHLFRDDLDLCWRAWLAGHDVEVVPGSVGEHVGGATNYLRLGQTRFIGPRYFAERNTLATLLKNYAGPRLLFVVPLYLLVGIAKVLGFLLTRRVADAWQTVRAWVWNVLHLRETWRLRREVQARRRRTDRELRELFGRITPRVRAYAEAVGAWIAGGDAAEPAPADPTQLPPEPTVSPLRRAAGAVRRRPVLLAGVLLTVLVLVGAVPLLVPGELRGGELAPWPATPEAFLTDYVAGWHQAGAFGTAAAPSPAQALLGALQAVLVGSTYAAPRVLLIGSLAVAWVLSLKAAQVYSRKRIPRVVAATAYVLSPPALAALATGRVGALIVFAVLPGIVAAGATLGRANTSAARAWRSVAAVALLLGIGGAFEPLLLVAGAFVGVLMVLGTLAFGSDAGWRRAVLARVLVAVGAPLVLLAPWSLDLLAPGGPVRVGGGAVVGGELWRWVALAPELAGFPGLVAGAGFVLAGLLGLVLGTPRAPVIVGSLWAAALLGAGGGWWLDRTAAATWAGLPLIVTAAAYAGLLAVGFATAEAQLGRHAFGWRQLATLATAVAVALSLVDVASALVRGPWSAYAVESPALPAFITTVAAEAPDDPFRVLVLADRDGTISWEVVDGAGPTMAAYGVPDAAAANGLVAGAVEDLLSGRDLTAASRLARLNVRYVVVPDGGTSAALDTALRSQLGLDPRPVTAGRVLSVEGWLPRAVVLDAAAIETLGLGALPADAPGRLAPAGPGRYAGNSGPGGTLLLAETAAPEWQVTADGRRLPVEAQDGLVAVAEVPADAELEISNAADTPRSLAVTGQLLVLLLVVSLALRPPRFARRAPDADTDALADSPLPPDDLPAEADLSAASAAITVPSTVLPEPAAPVASPGVSVPGPGASVPSPGAPAANPGAPAANPAAPVRSPGPTEPEVER
jgi:GT2 family glycosyltransferase